MMTYHYRVSNFEVYHYFSSTLWTKMSSLADSAADSVQLMPYKFLNTTDTAHQYKEGKGSSKSTETSTKTITSK